MSFPLESKRRRYLSIRKIAERFDTECNPKTNLPKRYPRFRRKIIKQYESRKFGDGIINVANGKRLALLVAEDIILEVLGARP